MGVSIILPVRDTPDNLDSTLESILSDSDLKNSDYELIVCNDGNSIEINQCTELWKQKGYNILHVGIHSSSGSYSARNRGIDSANFEMLIFFDVPISIEKGWFTPFKEMLTKYDYVAGDIKVKAEDSSSIAKRMYAATAFPVKTYFSNQHFGPTAFLGVRKHVFENVGLFEILQSGGDLEFGQRVFNTDLKMAFFDDFPAWHPPRNLKQQFWKKVRVYKGIKNLPEKQGEKRDPASFKTLFNCITAIPSNLIKYKKNKMYNSGLFSYPEYMIAVVQFWSVEFFSRLYVKLSGK